MRRPLIFLIAVLLIFAASLFFTRSYYTSPGPLTAPATVVFKKGEHFREIVQGLVESGVIDHPLLFKTIAVISGEARKFKAGEYAFTAAMTPELVMEMIASGKVIVHKLVVPEGWRSKDVTTLLAKEPLLEGETSDVPEGSLLPETYYFVYGDTRREMIGRMQTAMSKTLAELWPKRKEGLPFDSPGQAVTLASIVEKETGIPEERGKVAAVFFNRLRKGMRLQSDPTTQYAIEKDKGPMGRKLVLKDLEYVSPYNTYASDGLPPRPICNPGRASLEAALNPPVTDDLYFVATGNGGHNFSTSLKAHDKNVSFYHKELKKKAEKK